MSATHRTPTRSLGAELERDRLERRARRMTVAIASLHLLANESGRELGAIQGTFTEPLSTSKRRSTR